MPLLDELLGLAKPNPAPATPGEAAEPTDAQRAHRHNQTIQEQTAHPLVGFSADPTPPIQGENHTLAVRRVNAELQWDRFADHLQKLAAALEAYNMLRFAEAERQQDKYENARILAGTNGAYVMKRLGRRFARLWVSGYQSVQVLVPGQAATPRQLVPGWNNLDYPEGSRVYVATGGAAFDAVFCASDQPTVTPVDKAAGYVSPAATTTNVGADTALTFPVAVGHWVLQNNTAGNVGIEVPTPGNESGVTASAGSLQIPPGATWTSDVPVAILHVFTAAAQNVNGTTAGNIVVKGWQ